jgi:hypothetical protein
VRCPAGAPAALERSTLLMIRREVPYSVPDTQEDAEPLLA